MGQSQHGASQGGERRFNSYSHHFRTLFGTRVQKVAINAGLGCPNRDGTVGVGGCAFCLNEAFTPSYCAPAKSITRQIEEGVEFHARRYRTAGRYMAYFQSYSNTYGSLERLRELYDEALAHPMISGLIVSTRPDCISPEKLDLLRSYISEECYVAVEYGVESCYDATLRAVGRGHDFECARRAIEATAERGLPVGAHFILGLPGETPEMMIEQTAEINRLPLTSIKFHQLQLFLGTAMAADYEAHPERYHFFELDEYIELFANILRRLRPDIVVERFASEAPPRYHAGPNWGLIRNEQLVARLEDYLQQIDARQGDQYQP